MKSWNGWIPLFLVMLTISNVLGITIEDDEDFSASGSESGMCTVEELRESDIDVTRALDERPGFFSHYVLNVSWYPTSCMEGVSHYIVTRTSVAGNCGDTVTETVDAGFSSVLLQSKRERFLFLPCIVEVEVHRVLVDGTIQTVSGHRLFPAVRDSDFPRLEIVGCPVTYDRQSEKYEVQFQWTAPFPPSVLSHIDFFLIRGDKFQRGDINDALIELTSFRHIVFVNTFNNSLYTFTTLLAPFEDIERYYQMSVEVFWKEVGVPARSGRCSTVDTPAPPPLPIVDININSTDSVVGTVDTAEGAELEVRVDVRFEWEKPELQYTADILDYQVHLALEPLEPNEMPDQIESEGIQRSGYITKHFPIADVSRTVLTAYLQIRSRQFQNIPSNWSEPKQIEFDLLNLSSPTIVSSAVFTTHFTPDEIPGRFIINSTVYVHLDRPVNRRGLDFYEVWIGDRALEENEQPDGSRMSGIVYQFNVNSTLSRILTAAFTTRSTDVTLHIQTRSIGISHISKWSAPVTHETENISARPCDPVTITSTATYYILRTDTGPGFTVPSECIATTEVTHPTPTPTPAPDPIIEVQSIKVIGNTVKVTVRLPGAKEIKVILRDLNESRHSKQVSGSFGSVVFTDVPPGPTRVRAVGRGADRKKQLSEWHTFTVKKD